MCKENSAKNGKGDEEMSAVTETKPIKSTEINFNSEQEYNEFINFIDNPPETSEFVKELIKKYQRMRENN